MNWVDWIIVIILGLSAWKGYRSGLLVSLAGLFAWVVGFLAASHYYYRLSAYADERWNLEPTIQRFLGQHLPYFAMLPSFSGLAAGVVQVLAFLAVLLAVEIVIHSIARSLSSLIAVTPLVAADRVGGLIFGAVWGGVWVLVLTVVATRLFPTADWQGSVILPYFLDLTKIFHMPWPLVV